MPPSARAIFGRTIQHMLLSTPVAQREQLMAEFDPTELRMGPADARSFADTLADRARADGRVTGVAVSTSTQARFGRPEQGRDQDRFGSLVAATPSWFAVNGVGVLTGRGLEAGDGLRTVVVSRWAAEMIAPAGAALGRLIQVNRGRGEVLHLEVVGIVEDHTTGPTRHRPEPVLYVALPGELTSVFTLGVRSTDPDALETDLRAIVASVDPRMSWLTLRRGHATYLNDAKEMTYAAVAVGACGFVALILSATGLFAVVSYVVTLRRREIGLRIAIGASPRGIVGLVLRQALQLSALGTLAGLALSIPIAVTMSATFVERVNAWDPLVYAPPALLLLLVTGLAATAPALRAARVDPIATLRQD